MKKTKKLRSHLPGLSPATAGEKLIYAQCHMRWFLGEEIGTFHEAMGPGEKDPSSTMVLHVSDGRFRLERKAAERFDGRHWVPFEEFVQRSAAAQKRAPWTLPTGELALRTTSRVREISREEALRLYCEQVLAPGIDRLVPDCFAADVQVNVQTANLPKSGARPGANRVDLQK